MTYTLEQFVAEANAALSREPEDAALETVRGKLEHLLAEPDFISFIEQLDIPDGKRLLHRDEEFGYHVLAHHSRSDSNHPPHNHGRSWAIYGQVNQHTDVTEWTHTAAADGVTDLKVSKTYRLLPGHAGTYADGAIHSVSNPAGTRIIRITGTDLDRIDREGFDPATGAVRNLREPVI